MFIPFTEREKGTAPIMGQVTIGSAATPFTAANIAVKNGLIIKSLSSNANLCYIGDATVSASTGFPLSPGESTSIAIDNVSRMYVFGTNTEKIAYISSN